MAKVLRRFGFLVFYCLVIFGISWFSFWGAVLVATFIATVRRLFYVQVIVRSQLYDVIPQRKTPEQLQSEMIVAELAEYLNKKPVRTLYSPDNDAGLDACYINVGKTVFIDDEVERDLKVPVIGATAIAVIGHELGHAYGSKLFVRCRMYVIETFAAFTFFTCTALILNGSYFLAIPCLAASYLSILGINMWSQKCELEADRFSGLLVGAPLLAISLTLWTYNVPKGIFIGHPGLDKRIRALMKLDRHMIENDIHPLAKDMPAIIEAQGYVDTIRRIWDDDLRPFKNMVRKGDVNVDSHIDTKRSLYKKYFR